MKLVATKQILKKHVCVIHSASHLSLTSLQAADALLKNAFPDLLSNQMHTIEVKKLCDQINYNSRNYKHLREALESLMTTVVRFNVLSDQNNNVNKIDGEKVLPEKWGSTTLLAEAYVDGGICKYSYSRGLSRLLSNPSLFGLIDLDVNKKFSSKFGFLIYANCNRFRNLKSTPWFEMATFRQLMGLKEGKYGIFRDLKRRVIDAGVKEVNKYADIIVTPHYKKEQRQVVAIRFTIQRNSQLTSWQESINASTSVKLEQELIRDFGFSSKQVTEYIAQYSEKYINEKIHLIKNSSTFKSGGINDLGGYLRAALDQDYKEKVTSEDVIKRDNKEIDRRRECSEYYRRYLENCLTDNYSNIDDDIKQEFFQNQKHLAPKDGILSNSVLASWLLTFLKEKHPAVLGQYMSFEEYYKKWLIESLKGDSDE